ncbi:MAG: AAA family ATPase [Candidatus Riflebacteria bacterium]|nr:AAA family ATPase [Candidatus Riflebacteria bacterium]
MSDTITTEMIKNISLFEKLEDSDLEKLISVVQKGSIPSGTEFFKEGDIGDAFYVLTDGEVEVSKEINGKKTILTTIKSSDENNFFGEMALIEDLPRNATITSKTDCEILQIEKKNFDMLLRINSFVALRIMTALTKRLRADSTGGSTASASNEPQTKAQVITFFSPKGGAGKTSIATNIAYGMAKYLNKKVMLIDLDLQFGGIAFMLDLKPKKTIVDLTGSDALRSFDDIKPCLSKHKSGFDLLPAPLKPEQSENVDSTHLRKIVSYSKDKYDFILIDTHSLLQDISINALDISDIIMLVMNPDMGHIVAIHNCLNVMDSLKYPKEKIRLILNRFGSYYSKSKEELEGVFQKKNVKVNYVIHDDWKIASDLINNCQTAFESNNTSEYRNDIVTVISDLTHEELPAEAGSAGKKNLFSAVKDWFNS